MMRGKFLIVLLISFAFSLFAREKPEWIRTKKHPKYPERLYIIGVGAAKKTKDKLEDIRKANADAFADIAKQIKVTVKSKSLIEQIETITGKRAESIEKASAELQVTTELKIGGLKIVETYFDDDDDIYYSLAVLDRRSAGEELKSKLAQYHNLFSESFDRARQNFISGNLYQSMLNLSDACKYVPLYNEPLQVYEFVTRPLAEIGDEWEMPKPIIFSDVKSLAQDIFAKIKIEKVSGEEQEVVFNQPLQPLVLKISFSSGEKNLPVSGFKFKFELINGKGKISDVATSDANGLAKCEIYSLHPYEQNFYTISAKIDLSEFLLKTGWDFEEYADWNEFLTRNEKEITFTLRRKTLTLDDKLREAVLFLAQKLPETNATIAVARIYYQDKLPTPLAHYLKQKIELAIENYTELKLISDISIKFSQLSPQDEFSSPETFGKYAGAVAIITGDYWEKKDAIDLNLKVSDVNTKTVVATVPVEIPKLLLPEIPSVPENYNPKFDDEIIKTEIKGEELKVEVWVDRPDGIYYEGDTMKIFLKTNRDCYVQLVYYDAEGKAVVVFPHIQERNNRIRGNRVYQVPGTFVVIPPFGREILKAFASETPFPEPKGRIVQNLVVLDSMNDFVKRTRSLALQGGELAESTVVVTTISKTKSRGDLK